MHLGRSAPKRTQARTDESALVSIRLATSADHALRSHWTRIRSLLGVASVEGREQRTNSPPAPRFVALRNGNNEMTLTYPADWTPVHGFFAAMGGFVDGRRLLSLEDIEELVLNQEIEYPIATRGEIEDKSKGDPVTKALVVLQTTWFLMQCVARASQRLELTELELATAAFALLSIVIYALWWDKPLDVQYHIMVRRRIVQGSAREASPEQNPVGRQPVEESRVAPKQERDCWARSLGRLMNAWDALQGMFRGRVWMGRLESVIEPFLDMMVGGNKDETFFVVGRQGTWDAASAILVTMAFGGIHCIAWSTSFHFPLPIEQLLWRISSIAITGIPLAFGGIVFIGHRLDYYNPVQAILATIIYLLAVLYPVFRIVLLVLCFTTLRCYPPSSSVYQTVEWMIIKFVPHI